MIHLELGCGENRRDIDGWTNIGVDMFNSNCTNVLTDLAYENLPFISESVDLVQAYDFFEHIPKMIFSKGRSFPFINLMNEIFRVLKNGGKLILEVPFSDNAFYRDPTHVNRFGEDWYHYFCTDTLYSNQGLINCKYDLIGVNFRKYLWEERDIMHCELKKRENSSPFI